MLSNIEEPNISTLRDLKFYFQRKLSVRQIVSVGYMLNGRKMVWIKADDQLADPLRLPFAEGKGQCGAKELARILIMMTPLTPNHRKQHSLKKSEERLLDEKRERVQDILGNSK